MYVVFRNFYVCSVPEFSYRKFYVSSVDALPGNLAL